ncbi:hypothetical protein Patl1_18266 [Pistacia atlantica]|uniref:Uncharacterized protein n=1 Tax=Pistacia atlantica TaxID=434234 RepID=A0ACC1BXS0_9ROSI|nr:hypothetical protein Patl1_18266 [Pistacia atlantica]
MSNFFFSKYPKNQPKPLSTLKANLLSRSTSLLLDLPTTIFSIWKPQISSARLV